MSLQFRSDRRVSVLSAVILTAIMLVQPVRGDDKSAADDTPTDYELMRLFVETFQQVEANYVREVDRRELMEAAIQGMLHHLDQYSSFIPPREVRRFNQMVEQEFGGIGITVNQRAGKLVVISPLAGTPAWHGGIRAGDVIAAVDGDSTEGWSLNEAVGRLQGPVGRPVKVTVIHPGANPKREEIELVRELIKAPTVRGDRYNENAEWEFTLADHDDIGYLRLSHFSKFTAEEVRETVDSLMEKNVRGLVLDLRFNPGGLLESSIRIADLFLKQGNIVSVRGRNVTDRSWEAKESGTYPDFPMAVIVNRYSASASEVLSACLQDNKRAIIVGERTWGKGSVQNVIRMEQGDSALKLTTASYHRPSGANIHRFRRMTPDDRWGVTPDEGYLLKYSTAEWRAWDRDRSERDVLRQHDEASSDTESTEKPDESAERFVDRQLVAAVDYIRKQLEENSEQPPATTDAAADVTDQIE